eukprot:scaffold1203_cov193-Alexandrium_tamarense.AAC.8
MQGKCDNARKVLTDNKGHCLANLSPNHEERLEGFGAANFAAAVGRHENEEDESKDWSED